MKRLMFSVDSRVMAPVDDTVGGGDVEGTTEDAESTEGESDDEAESEEGEETDDGESDQEDAETEEDDENLGARAQKRIKKLIAEKKEATARFEELSKQLEQAKKLSGDDGKAIMAAAEASGILPGLMTKEDAEAQKKISQYGRVIDVYEEWLDNHDNGDEYDCGEGRTMSYNKVQRRVNQLTEELRDLKSDYGPRHKELKAKVREIYELGTAALKAGWKPGAKKSAKPKEVETRPTTKGQRIKTDTGRGVMPEDIDVNDGDDLEAFIIASNRRKKN